MLRTFTIKDLALLAKYKNQTLYPHNQTVLTRGPSALSRAGLLSPLASLTGSFTYVSAANSTTSAGVAQAQHNAGSPVAFCTLLAPQDSLQSTVLDKLIETLLGKVGERGAQHLLAEIDEGSRAYETLRQAGFSSYARQRVWRIENVKPGADKTWRPALSGDLLPIQLLRNSLLPGQVHQIETGTQVSGYVHYLDGSLLAYAEVARGPRGIWVQPFVHLDAEPFEAVFAELITKLRPRPSRPVYICVRSYQDWLEKTLEDLGAQPGPRQAAMARRTVLPLKVGIKQRVPVANRRVEPTTPIHALSPTRHNEPELTTYDQTPNYR